MNSNARKLKQLVAITSMGFSIYASVSFYRTEENFYKKVVMPLVNLMDPEKARQFAVYCNKHRLIPKSKYKDPDCLKVNLFGTCFSNPLGLASGVDKNGEALLGLRDIGFGFVEVGSVMPELRLVLEKPISHTLLEDDTVTSSESLNEVYLRIKNVKNLDPKAVIGVNLGTTEKSCNSCEYYIHGIKTFGPIADYLVINLTREHLKNIANLEDLLRILVATRNYLAQHSSLLIKISTDLKLDDLNTLAYVVQLQGCKVDGLIISSNTKDIKSNKMITEMKKLNNDLPIIAEGDISCGKDAYEKIKAGASVLQISNSLIHEGPPVTKRIKKELVNLLKVDGFEDISQLIITTSEHIKYNKTII